MQATNPSALPAQSRALRPVRSNLNAESHKTKVIRSQKNLPRRRTTREGAVCNGSDDEYGELYEIEELGRGQELLETLREIWSRPLCLRTRELYIDQHCRRAFKCHKRQHWQSDDALMPPPTTPGSFAFDGLGPDLFTRETLEAFKSIGYEGFAPILTVNHLEAIFPVEPSDLTGHGFAICGDFFRTLNEEAGNLPAVVPNEKPTCALFYAVDLLHSTSCFASSTLLFANTVKPDRDSPWRGNRFNLFKEKTHPHYGRLYQYIGCCSFGVDRNPNGRSLNVDDLKNLSQHHGYEDPRLLMIPEHRSPKEYESWFIKITRKRHAGYMPRVPYFEYWNYGREPLFYEKLVQLRDNGLNNGQLSRPRRGLLTCHCAICAFGVKTIMKSVLGNWNIDNPDVATEMEV